MSSAAISELVGRHGVRKVAEGFVQQGVSFNTAHLLILGRSPLSVTDMTLGRYAAWVKDTMRNHFDLHPIVPEV